MSSAEEATEYLFGCSAVCIKENNRQTIVPASLTVGYQAPYKYSSTIYPVILGMCSYKSDENISHPELYHDNRQEIRRMTLRSPGMTGQSITPLRKGR